MDEPVPEGASQGEPSLTESGGSGPAGQYGSGYIEVLPPGPGHDTTVRVCSGCHSPALAATQRLSVRGWYDLVRVMSDRGAIATDNELNEIAVYLAKSFPKRPDAEALQH